jgi:hypothetical protein
MFAEQGAQIAAETSASHLLCATLPALLSETLWRETLENAFRAAYRAVETETLRCSAPLREFASTLLLAVALEGGIAVGQIGDGAVVVQTRQGELLALTTPENGEHVNETLFLTSPNALESLQFRVWHGKATHVALFSDGLQRLALKIPASTPHAPFFTPLFRFLSATQDLDVAQNQLEAFLRSPRVTDRTDDDLTLVLAELHRDELP